MIGFFSGEDCQSPEQARMPENLPVEKEKEFYSKTKLFPAVRPAK